MFRFFSIRSDVVRNPSITNTEIAICGKNFTTFRELKAFINLSISMAAEMHNIGTRIIQ
jgi:hypothetical protein